MVYTAGVGSVRIWITEDMAPFGSVVHGRSALAVVDPENG
jgi:hypothetical protein